MKQLCLNMALPVSVMRLGTHMIDQALAEFRAHRQNINRYRSLLQTNLTELERSFVERRLAEEEAVLTALAFGTSTPLVQTPFYTPDTQ
jgi:hypothetical protein